MILGLVIEESQSLQTHLNLRSDLTGSLAKMFSTTSCGRWFFPCRRIKGYGPGSIGWDIFSADERFQFQAYRLKRVKIKRNKGMARICWIWVWVRLGLIDVFYHQHFWASGTLMMRKLSLLKYDQ